MALAANPAPRPIVAPNAAAPTTAIASYIHLTFSATVPSLPGLTQRHASDPPPLAIARGFERHVQPVRDPIDEREVGDYRTAIVERPIIQAALSQLVDIGSRHERGRLGPFVSLPDQRSLARLQPVLGGQT